MVNDLFNIKSKVNENYHIISAREPLSPIAEQYRKLRTNIEFSNIDKKIKVMNFTSAFPGEGKTLTSLNLATVYSQANVKTLLIDMDLRKPKVHRAFNFSNQTGLTAIVLNETPIEELILKATDYLDILPAGERVPFPVEFLMSKPLEKAVESLRNQYDKIIIDCPPMTAVTDANIISKYSDGTIIVVGSRHTNEDIAKDVVKNLQSNGANIIGSVLTRVRRKDQKYMAGYYYYQE